MGFLKDKDLSNVPSIGEYYKGKTIFITGGSGFMGKVLIEKLLYSCSELDRIYLLLRNKKGVRAEDRLSALYSSKCFDRLRNEKPNIFQEKVFFIGGDASEMGLGICAEDRILIINKTNIIFHVAASVRFDDSLKTAAMLNLRGTRELVELAKEVTNLEVLLHVSTSYANTNRKCIEEVVYPPFADWRDTLEVCENLDENTIKAITPKYLGELPNTYVFTKQLAEHVVYEQRGKLPIVIMRPSIVISSLDEPLAGWVENFNGPIGMLIASGKGILRTMYTDPTLKADYLPVDICIKTFIAGAWARGTKKLEPTDDVEVYNCSSNLIKSLTMGEIVEFGRKYIRDIPLEGALWHPAGELTTSKFVYYFNVLFFHLLPAILVDLVLKITGNKPMLVKIQRRVHSANIALQYFITQQWLFNNQNMLELRDKLQAVDRDHFHHRLEDVDLDKYFRQALIAGKQYLLKEKMENLEQAKVRYRRMELLDKVTTVVVRGFLLWILARSGYVKQFLLYAYEFF